MSKPELVYLSLDDRRIVMNGVADNGYYHPKDLKRKELWLRGDDEENNNVLTALISYEDEDFKHTWPDSQDEYTKEMNRWYDNTLQGKLCKLSNEKSEEYWVEVFNLFELALCNSELDNKTFKEVYNRLEGMTFYSRVVDFAMHEPTDDYIHTDYCT